MQSTVGETCWEGVSPYVADIIHGVGYTDDVHDDIILGNITSFIGRTAVPLTLAPSRIAHIIVLAGICSPMHSIVMMSLASSLALRLFANTCRCNNRWTISNSSLTKRTSTGRASLWCVLPSKKITGTGGWCANSTFTFAASISWIKGIYVRRCDSSVNLADPSSNKARRWVIWVKGIPAFRNTDMTSIRGKLCADSTAYVTPVPLRSSAWCFWYGFQLFNTFSCNNAWALRASFPLQCRSEEMWSYWTMLFFRDRVIIMASVTIELPVWNAKHLVWEVLNLLLRL